eukprot:s130_g16.t1
MPYHWSFIGLFALIFSAGFDPREYGARRGLAPPTATQKNTSPNPVTKRDRRTRGKEPPVCASSGSASTCTSLQQHPAEGSRGDGGGGMEMYSMCPHVRQSSRVLRQVRQTLDFGGRGLHRSTESPSALERQCGGDEPVAQVSQAQIASSKETADCWQGTSGQHVGTGKGRSQRQRSGQGRICQAILGWIATTTSTGAGAGPQGAYAASSGFQLYREGTAGSPYRVFVCSQGQFASGGQGDLREAAIGRLQQPPRTYIARWLPRRKPKRQLLAIQASRAAYLEAWHGYVDNVATLIQQQVAEQQKQLETFDEAELQWTGSLEKSSADLARLAKGASGSVPEVSDMEQDGQEYQEALEDADIRTAGELKQRRERQLATTQQLVAAVETVRQSAKEQLSQQGRDGSRTPRRRKEPVHDLTKEEPTSEMEVQAKDDSANGGPAARKDAKSQNPG